MKYFCAIGAMLSLGSAVFAEPLSEDMVKKSAAYIDRLMEQELREAKVRPMPKVDDATFLRRVYLGIVGRIPSAEEARTFLDDRASDKRVVLVDRLVASAGFDSHLFNWTADLLRLQTKQEQFGLGWHVWLRRSLAEDKPWDVMVAEMLSAEGHAAKDPAVGYYLRDRNMQLDNFSNTMQVFLGQQMGCAQCHDHPFADWSQYDYYQMASFGGGIQYQSGDVREMVKRVSTDLYKPKDQKAGLKPPANKKQEMVRQREQRRDKVNFVRKISRDLRPLFRSIQKNAIVDNERQELRLPKDYKYRDGKPGEAIKPATLIGPELADVSQTERLDTFASWVVSRENPYFTKTIVNRLWQRTFGYPLLDSLDDLTEDSETRHPKTLAYLDTVMKGVDYDLRQFLRILYRTELYQRACMSHEPVMGEPLAFSGMVLTRMTAEQLYDSFLVLRHGEVNDEPSPSMAKSWNEYTSRVDALLAAETNQVMMLAESAQQGEQRLRKAQADMRAARDALANANGRTQRQKAFEEMKEIRERMNEAREQADPFRSMGMMTMMGAKDDRRRAGQLRISELPAPMNPGTLVRQFGGSDRETPSSSNADATVPQALALLNNPKMDLASGKSDLSRRLSKIKDPDEKVEELFLSLFAARPNIHESSRYSPYARNDESLRDLAVAMLSSNRFIFVQ